MLFMGEEWAAGTPWQFFTDHTDPELADAVRRGRRREFAAHGWKEEDVPDPQDPATRDRSCLDWSEPEREPHARVLAWYRQLLALRHGQPDLTDPDLADTKVAYDEERRWIAFRRGDVLVAVNLAAEPAALPLGVPHARVLAAWEPVEKPGADGVVRLPGESAVVLLQE
jgi:maltooligosyltrehalose trehalohydrolase